MKVINDIRYYSLKEFASMVDVTYNTVLNWKKYKNLSTKKIGGNYFVTQTEIDLFTK